MASFLQYTASGGASQAFSIPTFSSDEIKVYVDGVLKTATTHYNITSYTTNGGTVTWTSGNVPSSGTVRIVRDTGVTTARATYAAGSSIKAGDLNDNQTQALRSLEEQDDQLIQTYDVEDAAITTAKIKADNITGALIADDQIDSEHIAAGAVDLEHMSANSVDSDQYVDNSIDTAHIADDQVTYAKIQNVSATDRVLGRDSSGAGIIEEITPANLRTMLNIEDGATGDQSNAEIRTAVGAASDSNILTDALKSKLDGIASSANNYSISSDLLDEDNMASNSATKAASQQSIKAYVDANAGSGEANQNAFSNVAVSGQTTVAADSATDTLTLAGGSNVTITTNAGTDTVTIAASGGEVTVQDEGSALSTAATTLNFVGAGVTASGSGATKTITISGGGGAGVTTDFQYLELKAHNNASGAFSAGSASYELVTKGTNTVVSPTQAAALIINIAGVIQEPNTGTSIGSNDGFCIDGSSIHFGANLTAHPDYILYLKGAGEVTALANSSVTNAKIADDTISEAKLDIHNAPSGTDKYLKYTSNGMEWATAGSGTPEGTAILSTGESGGTKFLREDGDGSCSWQSVPAGVTQENVEDWVGGMVTGNTETGITVTYEDSDGTLDFVVASQTDNNFTTTLKNKLDGIAASANAYVHPNHSGEVTSTADGATVIADNVVDEANLKVSNAPTNGYVLTARSGNTGGMTWEEASGGGITDIIEHKAALTANLTIGTGNNGLVAGPFSTGSYTLTIPSGSVFTVV